MDPDLVSVEAIAVSIGALGARVYLERHPGGWTIEGTKTEVDPYPASIAERAKFEAAVIAAAKTLCPQESHPADWSKAEITSKEIGLFEF